MNMKSIFTSNFKKGYTEEHWICAEYKMTEKYNNTESLVTHCNMNPCPFLLATVQYIRLTKTQQDAEQKVKGILSL